MKISKKDIKSIQKLPVKFRFFILLILFCSSAFSFFSSFSKDYFVDYVVDADTIYVLNNGKKIKVRFWGIDAPESKQRYGKYCTKELSKLINHQNVKLDIKTTDTYGRKVAIVYHNDKDINKEIVRMGCAWAYTYYTNAYKNDELYARANKLGLWQDKKPTNPYIWRKKHKGK